MSKRAISVISMYKDLPKEVHYKSFNHNNIHYEYCGRPSKFGNYTTAGTTKDEKVEAFNQHVQNNLSYYKSILQSLLDLNMEIRLVCFCKKYSIKQPEYHSDKTKCHCDVLRTLAIKMQKEATMNKFITTTIIEKLLNQPMSKVQETLQKILNTARLQGTFSYYPTVMRHPLIDIEYRVKDNIIVSVIPRVYVQEELNQHTVKTSKFSVIGIDKTKLTVVEADKWELKASKIKDKTVYAHYKNYNESQLKQLCMILHQKGFTTIYLGIDKDTYKVVRTLRKVLLPSKRDK